MLLRVLLTALVLACLQGCGIHDAFRHGVTLDRGHDAPGDADRIYLQVHNVQGMDSGEGSLTLPEGWSGRPAAVAADGVLELDPPAVPTWTLGQLQRPHMFVAGALAENTTIPLAVRQLGSGENLNSRLIRAAARERLRAGGNMYFFVSPNAPESDHYQQDDLVKSGPSFSLVGARWNESADDIEWVRLCRLDFQDPRGGGEKTLNGVIDGTSSVLVGSMYLAALLWPVWFFV